MFADKRFEVDHPRQDGSLLLNLYRFDVLYLSFTMVVGGRLMSVLPDLR
jgi:hypothetical protein